MARDCFALPRTGSIVGYDLMCEPHPDGEASRPLGDWNVLAQKITAAIRAVDERTPILVNSSGWAYPQQFEALRPTGDPRTVYTVHCYDPHYYTHQIGCARFAPGVEEWLRDQIGLYEQSGWSWAYWAFREWDVMNFRRTSRSLDCALAWTCATRQCQ